MPQTTTSGKFALFSILICVVIGFVGGRVVGYFLVRQISAEAAIAADRPAVTMKTPQAVDIQRLRELDGLISEIEELRSQLPYPRVVLPGPVRPKQEMTIADYESRFRRLVCPLVHPTAN